AAAAPNQAQPAAGQAPAVGAAPPAPAARSTDGFGVGTILGEPTGLSLKYWLTAKSAVDGGVAWSFKDNDSFHLHGDYLWHNFDLLPVNKGRLPFYFGVGGRVLFEEDRDTRFGVRGPVGLAYMFANAPVDIFVEVAPIIDITPKTKLTFNGGIGVRYYFK
ncbi:MAG: hypothetical protein AB1705_18730, partial [Verrucomicrobiota bacterium]